MNKPIKYKHVFNMALGIIIIWSIYGVICLLYNQVYENGLSAGFDKGYDQAISICLGEGVGFPYWMPTETREISFYKKCGLIKDNKK